MRHSDGGIVTATRPSASVEATRGRMVGLDGVRGIAVALVVVYHLWPGLLPGGFVGVTVFFALSGFLIVGLLCSEHERTGRIDLGSFALRRVRRLLPLSVLVLLTVAIVWTAAGWMTAALRREMTFSVFQLANWGQLTAGVRYGVEATPSPVVHFWSLAIEEQVYVTLPVVVALLGGRRWLVGAAVATGLAVSTLLTVRWAGDATTVYFSTFTRMGEIFVGGLVAVALYGRTSDRVVASVWLRRSGAVVAVVAVIAVFAAARTWSVSDAVVHRGGLLVVGALAALMVGGVAVAPGLGRVADVAPLAWLGRVSYAVYLIHWPVLIGLGAAGVPVRIVPWATLAITAVAAWASAHWFEHPIRVGRVRSRRLVASVVTVALVVPVVAGAGVRAVTVTDFEAAEEALAAELAGSRGPGERSETEPVGRPGPDRTPAPGEPAGDDALRDDALRDDALRDDLVPSVPPASAPSPSSGPEPSPRPGDADADEGEPWAAPVVVGYFGDSKALTLALGAQRDPPAGWALGTSWARLGCPLGRGGRVRLADGDVHVFRDDYCVWSDYFADGPDGPDELFGPVDVAVIWFGTWDLLDRRIDDLGDGWTNLDDSTYRAWLRSEYELFIDALIEVTEPSRILLLTEPSGSHAMRAGLGDAWRRFLRVVAAPYEGLIEVVDIAAWVDATDEPDLWLPDGLHPTFEDTTDRDEDAVGSPEQFDPDRSGSDNGALAPGLSVDPRNTATALHDALLLPVVRGVAVTPPSG